MLGKLLKYEMKAMGRLMLPLYGLLVLSAALLGISIRLNMSRGMEFIVKTFTVLTTTLFIVLIVASVVVMTVLVIQRFYKNLLGSEGYLMFTLPAGTMDHILCKLISSAVWIAAGIMAGVLAGVCISALAGSFGEFEKEVKAVWDSVMGSGQSKIIILQAFQVFMLIVASVLERICKVYASMAVGHQWGEHRILGSVLAYIVLSNVEGLFISLLVIRTGLAEYMQRLDSVSAMFGILTGILCLGMAIYVGLTWYLLDRRLNLE